MRACTCSQPVGLGMVREFWQAFRCKDAKDALRCLQTGDLDEERTADQPPHWNNLEGELSLTQLCSGS